MFQRIRTSVLCKQHGDFKSIAITLEDFEENVIDFICDEELLINIFPTENEPIGRIVDLNKFAKDLSILLEEYE